MTRASFPLAAQQIAADDIELSSATLRLLLFVYGYDRTGDVVLADVAGGDRIAISDPLTGVTILADGHVTSDPASFSGVTAGINAGGYLVYVDTGSEATSTLVGCVTETGAGVPIDFLTPASGLIVIAPNTAGWFQI